MLFYDLDDFMILSIKGVQYRCFVFSTSKNTTIKLLHNSPIDNKSKVSMVGFSDILDIGYIKDL